MNDTLSVKNLSLATIDAANTPGTARSFPRIIPTQGTPSSERHRQSNYISSLSPTLFRIGHETRKGSDLVRSLAQIDQTLTRVDGLSNPIGTNRFNVGLQLTRDSGCSSAELKEGITLLLGAFLENNGALIDQFINKEA